MVVFYIYTFDHVYKKRVYYESLFQHKLQRFTLNLCFFGNI